MTERDLFYFLPLGDYLPAQVLMQHIDVPLAGEAHCGSIRTCHHGYRHICVFEAGHLTELTHMVLSTLVTLRMVV